MSLYSRFIAWLSDRIRAKYSMRAPDLIIGEETDPYLLRWYLIPRNRFFNIYAHCFLRSDDDRALHDHPWFWMSVLLEGCYVEHTIAAGGINDKRRRCAGSVRARSPWFAHRLELLPDHECWTLFITGPRMREWGFHCPNGWRHWKEFTANDGRTVGRGCD